MDEQIQNFLRQLLGGNQGGMGVGAQKMNQFRDPSWTRWGTPEGSMQNPMLSQLLLASLFQGQGMAP